MKHKNTHSREAPVTWSIHLVAAMCLGLLGTSPIVNAAMVSTAVGKAVHATGRCDLQSSRITGPIGCLDLGSIAGTTLKVPTTVTRMGQGGLVLCGTGKITIPGNDIAYIVDQSGSMTAFHEDDAIIVHGADTINFGGCKEWTGMAYPGTLSKVKYKKYEAYLLPSSAYDSAIRKCSPTGDPYQARAKVVRAAITRQQELSPSSNAAFLSFGTDYNSTKLFGLSTLAARDSLNKLVIDDWLDKTNYANPIGWARVLLQGAKSGSKTIPASPNAKKAIILVSDGAPNDEDAALAMLNAGQTVKGPDGSTWTLPDAKSPPIYGFMLSTNSSSGGALKKLAAATGGAYYQIPPLDRDSLSRVMERLMGLLATTSTPNSLRISNLTNGQVSNSVSSKAEGAGFRFPLDSIIGLDTGRNVLELRTVMHGTYGDSTTTIRWTIDVTPHSAMSGSGGSDSTLTAECYEPTSLRVRPATDTARRFADQRDTWLATFLDTKIAGSYDVPVWFSTVVSGDVLKSTLSLPVDPNATRALVSGSNAWTLSTSGPIRTDATVQTGYGWDTLRATFHMPRDYRDSATAVLPLYHLAPTGIVLSPDTASGDSGRIVVVVTDPNRSLDTNSAWVHHRLGDSVRVALRRTAPGTYSGPFRFRQDLAIVAGDTVLQMGPARVLAFDSIWGAYQSGRDTTLVRRIHPRIWFVDAAGRRLDSMPRRVLDVGQSDTIRVGLFVNAQFLSQSDSAVVVASAWLTPSTGLLRIVNGLGILVVEGTRPGLGGAVTIQQASTTETLVRELDVDGLRLRFLREDGTIVDAIEADTVARSRVRLRVQLWSGTGPVVRSAMVRAASPDPRMVFTDAAGRPDSVFPLVAGVAEVWVASQVPAAIAGTTFAPDSSWAAATAGLLVWRSLAPDSAEFVDRDGDGILDRVRVWFALPWNPANLLSLHWPDPAHALDLAQAVATPSVDSLVVDWDFANPSSPLATSWTAEGIPGMFAWDAADATRSFPVRESLAPVPIRAWRTPGAVFDTLRVTLSERSVGNGDGDWIRWGRPSSDSDGATVDRSVQALDEGIRIDMLVDPSFPATTGDSIRLAIWPAGGLADDLGNGPARSARWVPLEILPGPFQLSVEPWPAMTTFKGWTIPPQDPPLALYVRTSPEASWTTSDGMPAEVDPTQRTGILILTTRNLVRGSVYVYDNAGIAVATVNLEPVIAAIRAQRIRVPTRGDLQIWVAWNGTSGGGRLVSSGVYPVRVFGWAEVDGDRRIFNQVHRLGWRIP